MDSRKTLIEETEKTDQEKTVRDVGVCAPGSLIPLKRSLLGKFCANFFALCR